MCTVAIKKKEMTNTLKPYKLQYFIFLMHDEKNTLFFFLDLDDTPKSKFFPLYFQKFSG
jgi:hypothetical protein